MAKVWDKPITAETDWGGDASTDNLPVSGRQVQAWIKSNIKSDAQISQLIVSWLNTHTINSPVFWKGLPIDADTLSWDGDKLTVIGSDGESQPFVYDAEKKAWLFPGDLVATGAITMFGDFNKFKPSTIMDAVQVDDITIGKTTEGVLYAKSGGGSGGSGMSYEEINQIVSNAIQNKADKATTLEGYGIENAYDKSYIDTLAYKLTTVYNWGDHSKAGYVFKDTKQDISARHNFTNGIEIGGLAAYKSKDDVVFLDANLVVRGAITMYGDNGTTSKTIWENIPFDSTMQWNGSTWSVVGGGCSSINEDAVNLLIGEYLTNNNYASEQWVSNQGYAKQSSLDGVDNRLKSVETFFATSDTDSLVNKWSEIVTFLNATEGDTLDNILKTKANQSALDDAVASLTTEIGKKWTQNDAKIANWDSAYGWGNHANAGYAAKTYVDGELAKYVKLATAQTISARHNFSDGLQIGGITIRKSQDGVVYIDGNLVIKGALTMFGMDATIPSSIWASIPFDSTMKWDGSKWSVVGGGSGSVDDAKVNVLISEYLAKNSYATQSWVQNQGYLTTHQSISHLLSKTDAANTYQPIINSSNKLAYSLISGTPDLNVYFRSSDFTKANIKSTLGISDWALAATKPSYTAAEVGALAISGNTRTLTSYDNTVLVLKTSGYHSMISLENNYGNAVSVGYYSGRGAMLYNNENFLAVQDDGTPVYNTYPLIHSDNIGSYNAGSATKLATPRTIWGQSFDGTGDVSGQITNHDSLVIDAADYYNSYWSRGFIFLANGVEAGGVYGFGAGKNLSDIIITASGGRSNGQGIMLFRNGNVSVGIADADAKLHVHGGIKANDRLTIDTSTNAPIKINTSVSQNWISAYEASAPNLSSGQHINISFGKSNSYLNTGWIGYYHYNDDSGFNRVCIGLHSADDILNVFGNGNVAIGGTTADAKLHVHGDILSKGSMRCVGDYGGFALYSGIRDGEALAIERLANHGGWVGMGITMLNNGDVGISYPTPQAKLHVGGDILADGAITMFSQLSLKNVIDYDGLSLEQLAQIKPARFTWKDGRDSLVHAGGIADEVMQVLPEVVYRTKDDKLTMDYGSAAFYIGASLIKPVVELWEAKDKQQQEIESLKKRVEYLEKENRQLRA